ncbi:RWP-RK domain-containing protein [Quillaja saponaria]|uniref:RWP-RK domain-containing protein n=1 Tax=Quillaja saponaria TaxID=32244 RepID=A0AAD7QBF9_QUISA|nr:RWP-RK domain-containing protein [Quillaja saponaria]
MENFPSDPLYASLDIEPRMLQGEQLDIADPDLFCDIKNELAVWNEISTGFDQSEQKGLLLCNNNGENKKEILNEERVKVKRCREERSSCSKMLSRKTISQYFYMPITQAAKELNVGLTLLKKRCRELGIRRWPHRKLMSLQTLIKNVQELEKEGEESEEKLKNAIEILEREKKLLEEMPDLQLEDHTKRLRQACFKANYKKRKIMGENMAYQSICNTNGGSASGFSCERRNEGDDEEEDDELKSLLSDSYSSSNMVF